MSEIKSEEGGKYCLRLFVAGDEPNSKKAEETLKRLAETRLRGLCTIEVVDVLNDFRAAIENNILVVPTLVVEGPDPPVKIIGSLSDVRKVLDALGLPNEEELL